MNDPQLLINKQHINYFLEKEKIIKENEDTKSANYLLLSFLLITSTVLLLKFIEEQNNKKSNKRLNRLY